MRGLMDMVGEAASRRFFVFRVLCFAAVLSAAASLSAASPRTTLECSATNLIVTETYTLTVRVAVPPLPGKLKDVSPFPQARSDPFDFFSGFGEGATRPQLRGELPGGNVRFSLESGRAGDAWTLSFVSEPIRATKSGKFRIAGLQALVPVYTGEAVRGFFGVQRVTRTLAFTLAPLEITVSDPPEKGRPASWCRAIGTKFAAVGALDARTCTAGDPLLYSLTVSGDAPVEDLVAPDLAAAVKDPRFRVDAASLKTESRPDGKRWTWRVRVREAGTLEFPAVDVAWFDVPARRYRIARTASIPLQAMAGEQVALGAGGAADALEEDAFPLPDGLDLDFPAGGTADFTLDRAVALACRATDEKSFVAAADAYAAWLEARHVGWFDALLGRDRVLNARHFANLAALQTLAGRPRAAFAALRRAEWFTGETPALRRTLVAARARLLNDPRAEAPPVRLLAPFFFRLNLAARIGCTAGVLLLVGIVFALASRLGRRLALVAALAGVCAGECSAQFNFSFSSQNMGGGAGKLSATFALEPAEVVVGQPAAFVLRFKGENGVMVQANALQVGGLPSDATGAVEYGELEQSEPNVFRVPVRFLAPFKGQIAVDCAGMAGTQRHTKFGSFSSSGNFRVAAPPLALAVAPLPEAGRPADFSGAVGKNFRLTCTLDPVRVHPGDLVAVAYALTFEGHVPSNVAPAVAGLDGFKVYPREETARATGRRAWRQSVIPSSAAATNDVVCSLSVYDLAAKKYVRVASRPVRLTFVSAEKQDTRNQHVLVDGGADAAPAARGRARTLRFAPNDASPVVAVVPEGVELRETGRRGAWRRMAAPAAAGWMR